MLIYLLSPPPQIIFCTSAPGFVMVSRCTSLPARVLMGSCKQNKKKEEGFFYRYKILNSNLNSFWKNPLNYAIRSILAIFALGLRKLGLYWQRKTQFCQRLFVLKCCSCRGSPAGTAEPSSRRSIANHPFNLCICFKKKSVTKLSVTKLSVSNSNQL